MIGTGNYMKTTQVKNKLDRSNTSQAHSQADTYVRGLQWNQCTVSVGGGNLIKFIYEIYTWNKDKIRHGQNIIQK